MKIIPLVSGAGIRTLNFLIVSPSNNHKTSGNIINPLLSHITIPNSAFDSIFTIYYILTINSIFSISYSIFSISCSIFSVSYSVFSISCSIFSISGFIRFFRIHSPRVLTNFQSSSTDI